MTTPRLRAEPSKQFETDRVIVTQWRFPPGAETGFVADLAWRGIIDEKSSFAHFVWSADDDIAAAIVYAVENGARIINMSFGDPNPSHLLRDAVRYAADAGCICVAAAGNEGSDEVFYPARSDETIAVAASDSAGRILSFSNRGFSIDLAAPGLRIPSLEPDGFGVRSGTSMAAAHVSGVAALILARNPQFTPALVRSTLANRARDLAPAGWDASSGAGIVQVPEPVMEQPVGVRILSPLSGTDVGDVAVVRVAAMGRRGGGGRLEVSWGRGEAPLAWTELLSAGVPAGETEVEALWSTIGLASASVSTRPSSMAQKKESEPSRFIFCTERQ